MQEKLPDVRDAFGALARAIKRVGIYRHARDQHLSYLEPALQTLASVLMREPTVTVQVEPSSLVSGGEAVYSEVARESSLCFRLHRDGVRSLTFTRGVSLEELLAFIQVALPDEGSGAIGPGREDAVTELWKADLRNISYTAVAGYRMEQDEADREGAQNAIADVESRASGSLLRFADPIAPDEEAEARLAPPLIGEADRRQLDGESWSLLAQRAAQTLLDVVAGSYAGRDLASLEEAYGRLLDEMIDRNDAEALSLVVGRPPQLPGAQAAEFRAALGLRLSDLARLQRVLELSRQKGEVAARVLPAWLSQLPAGAGEALLDALDGEDVPAQRALLAQAAARRLDGCRRHYEQKLRAAPTDLSRALLAALQLLPADQRARVASSALQHRSVQVRVEALAAVGADAAVLVQHAGPLLTDREPLVRLAAAEVLGRCGALADEASRLLLASIARDEFAAADRAEQGAFHRALGRLGSAAGFAFLSERLAGPRRLLQRKKRLEDEQLLAVQGLTAEASARSLQALEQAAAGGHPAAVLLACKVAAVRVRQQLARGRP